MFYQIGEKLSKIIKLEKLYQEKPSYELEVKIFDLKMEVENLKYLILYK